MPETEELTGQVRVITVPYGDGVVSARIPAHRLAGVAVPPSGEEGIHDQGDVLRRALSHPVGSPTLRELARGRQSAVVVTGDYTRATPTARMLPLILGELQAGGMDPARVVVLVGGGIHPPSTLQQARRLVGEGNLDTFDFRLAVHHPDREEELVRVGRTSYGVEVWLNREYVSADLRVALGTIEPHHLAGWSGGAKAVLPGVAGRSTVTGHHALAMRPGVEAGVLEGNPFREGLEEVLDLCPLHFVLNVALDQAGRIVQAWAGHPVTAHRAGVSELQRRVVVWVPERYPVVVVSLGGAPRDGDLWQAEGKGLGRARPALAPGGVLILCARMERGVGDQVLARYLGAGSPAAVRERFRAEEFSVAGFKAWRLARLVEDYRVFLVTEGLRPGDLPGFPVRFFGGLQAALDEAFRGLPADARVYVIPRSLEVIIRYRKEPPGEEGDRPVQC